MSGDPSIYKYEKKLIYGVHPEGILEIKIHNPKKKNAIGAKAMQKFRELFEWANTNDSIKTIVIHGGEIFSTGNDVELFEIGREDIEEVDKIARSLIADKLNRLLVSMYDCNKPIVAVVSGMAIGIGFTMLSLADFVYCTPETRFFTPFMQSFQSPEGGSTAFFPDIFGPRKTNEIILLDQMLLAPEA